MSVVAFVSACRLYRTDVNKNPNLSSFPLDSLQGHTASFAVFARKLKSRQLKEERKSLSKPFSYCVVLNFFWFQTSTSTITPCMNEILRPVNLAHSFRFVYFRGFQVFSSRQNKAVLDLLFFLFIIIFRYVVHLSTSLCFFPSFDRLNLLGSSEMKINFLSELVIQKKVCTQWWSATNSIMTHYSA